jgi:hypothetical protein
LVEIHGIHCTTAVVHSRTGLKQSVPVEDFKLIGTRTTRDNYFSRVFLELGAINHAFLLGVETPIVFNVFSKLTSP